MIEIDEYLTPKDIQNIFKIGRNKVYQLCSLKGFPSIKIGTTYRINKSKFVKWMEKHEGMDIFLN
ncbi:MAG: helix-turn-helix domain-containing protein [Lachnospiraceae bacterium]|nr:helix-turn-helix domain-containing protein [Lachnospiraceae bacterium]